MLELPGDLRLGDETVAVERLFRELLVEALQRDVADEVPVRGGVDAAHAASPDLREDAQVSWRRDPFTGDLLLGDLVVARDRNGLDDVDWLGLRFVCHLALLAAARGLARRATCTETTRTGSEERDG